MCSSFRISAFTALSVRCRGAIFGVIGDHPGLMGESLERRDAAAELRVCVLGPVVVMRGAEVVPVASARQRAILAVLALHAGEIVSVDDLVDGVWEEAGRPASAAGALQTQISRLRALLGDGIVETRPPGYVLRVPPERIDVHVLRTGTACAQRALAEDDPERARRLAESAVGLLRGAPLADVVDAPFAPEAQRMLEEARLAAFECLIQARLELGEHAELVDQLRALVGEAPYRERLWAQLMLALYRSGRQAEALDAYVEARRRFAEELGLEPSPLLAGLQAQVLRHDPALAPRHRSRDLAGPRRTIGRRRWVGGVLAALVAVGFAVLIAVDAFSGARPGGAAVGPFATGSVVRLDATTGAVKDRVPVGLAPGPIAVGAGAVWALDLDAETVTEVRSGHTVATFALGAPLIDVAAGNELFVGTGTFASGTQIAGPVVGAVERVAPATRTVRAKTVVPREATVDRPPDRQLAFAGGALLSIAADGSVVRIRDDLVDGHLRGIVARSIASGGAGVWVVQDDGTVARLDPGQLAVTARTHPAATSLGSLAVGAHEVWAGAPADGVVWRIPATDPLQAQPIKLQSGVGAIAISDGAVWVANPLAGTVTRLDERTGRVRQTIPVGGEPRGLAAAGNDVWVSVASPGPTAGQIGAGVGAASCEPAYAQRGIRPDALLVSDLPLQGGIRVSATDMTAAIALTLRLHNFRAGSHRVGFVSCDDSLARTGIFDAARCAANARAYVAAPQVLGIVGALNSPCTAAALNELDAAGGRAPAMVSPLSSDPALTRNRSSPAFARVYPTDDLQGAALASLAQTLGAKRVYVLDDGDRGYGSTLADAFVRAAARLHVRIVGSDSWNPAAPSRAQPLERAAAATPDAIVLSGLLDDGGIAVLRGLRRLLPHHTRFLLTDGFMPSEYLAERAGHAAEGAYISVPGATLDALTATGHAFGRELATVAPGAETDPASYYAADAANVLLDAIAVSDGSRPSVRRAVRDTQLRDGMFGPVGFDSHGDIRQPAVSLMQVELSDHSRQDVPRTRLFEVIRPPRALISP
jgi:DNA-binding SARP family transcriptional activator/ABC-type branched-subunit amino acid transport system substrate-binding protein/DNA-binding beta-propeller fold protein YncE